MSRQLIVSGDDLGLHEAINLGVVLAHDEGIVTSASLVPCGPAFEHACTLAKARPTLDLGIHLTLVEEKPVLGPDQLKTLAPEGRLPTSYRQLFLELVAGRIDLSDVERELEAQMQRVLKMGLAISHLDSHQHTHFFPLLQPIFVTLAKRHGIRGLRASTGVMPSWTKFSFLLGPLAKRTALAARAKGLMTPDTLWLPATSGRVTESELLAGLAGLPEGVTELVVHPGSDQAVLDSTYPGWRFEWSDELAAVRSPSVRERLVREGVRLTRYSELA